MATIDELVCGLTGDVRKAMETVAVCCRSCREARSNLLPVTGELAQLEFMLELWREDRKDVDDCAIPEDVHDQAFAAILDCTKTTAKIHQTLPGSKSRGSGGVKKWTSEKKAEVNGLRELLRAQWHAVHMALDAVALLAGKRVKSPMAQVSVTVHDISSDSEEVIEPCTAVRPSSASEDQELVIVQNSQSLTPATGTAINNAESQVTSLNINPYMKRESPTSQWDTVFERLDQDGNGVITGDEAVPFFQQFNLPSSILGEVWGQADEDNKGYLTKTQFCTAMQLVQQARRDQLFDELDTGGKGYLLGTEASPFFEQSCLPVETLGRIWQQVDQNNKGFLTREEFGTVLDLIRRERVVDLDDKERFCRVFDQIDVDGKGVISGEEASLFLKNSRLPDLVLGQIWELADVDGDGYLDKDEFAIAMHLIKRQKMGVERLPKVVISGVRFFDT
ncbi:hypothetical protein QBC41DRAFT_324755 [Cercophora samala]|uniref:Uncharacterized protein n=1 Tax=Cercophora samala TaxID=330535 RepID=A0AA39ZA28_9PEZI|nr:hypothetical protein QBC41DRAFT_324755 [Cercophora samala]